MGKGGSVVVDGKILIEGSDNVKISNFTLISEPIIVLRSSNITIENCLMKGDDQGVGIRISASSHVVIKKCKFFGCNGYDGIDAYGVKHLKILQNVISLERHSRPVLPYILNSTSIIIDQIYRANASLIDAISEGTMYILDHVTADSKTTVGIFLSECDYVLIQGNEIKNCNVGIYLEITVSAEIKRNDIRKNSIGLFYFWVYFIPFPRYKSKVIENNFVRNKVNALSAGDIVSMGLVKWRRNYWNRPRLAPYPVPHLGIVSLGMFYHISAGVFFRSDPFPAKLPYKVKV